LKGRAYINAVNGLANVTTVNDFIVDFDKDFNIYSPVGDEETTKFLSGIVLNIVSQSNQSEDAAKALVEYLKPHINDKNSIHIITIANIYDAMWQHYKKPEYFFEAESYYKKALSYGSVPPVLYGLLKLYSTAGDKAHLKEIGNLILSYWPDDQGVQALLIQAK